MSYYFYVRPDRTNWEPTVEECRQQLLRELLKGETVERAKGSMFQRFQNVSNTYWDEFWKEVTAIPLGKRYVRG
jgi:hypothetical protein